MTPCGISSSCPSWRSPRRSMTLSTHWKATMMPSGTMESTKQRKSSRSSSYQAMPLASTSTLWTGSCPSNDYPNYSAYREVSSTAILKNLGLWSDIKKPLPFRLSADPARNTEEVGASTTSTIYPTWLSQTYCCKRCGLSFGPNDPSLTSTGLVTGTSSPTAVGASPTPLPLGSWR